MQQSQAEKKRVKEGERETEGVEKNEEVFKLSPKALRQLKALRHQKKGMNESIKERLARILTIPENRISVQKDYENIFKSNTDIICHYGNLSLERYICLHPKDSKLPRHIIGGGDLNLPDLTSAKGVDFPETIDGSLNIKRLLNFRGIIHWPSHIGWKVRVSEKLSRRDREFLENKYPGRVTTFL